MLTIEKLLSLPPAAAAAFETIGGPRSQEWFAGSDPVGRRLILAMGKGAARRVRSLLTDCPPNAKDHSEYVAASAPGLAVTRS